MSAPPGKLLIGHTHIQSSLRAPSPPDAQVPCTERCGVCPRGQSEGQTKPFLAPEPRALGSARASLQALDPCGAFARGRGTSPGSISVVYPGDQVPPARLRGKNVPECSPLLRPAGPPGGTPHFRSGAPGKRLPSRLSGSWAA